MVDTPGKLISRVVKQARRFGLSKPEAVRMRADAERWVSEALRRGHRPEDVRLLLTSDGAGSCRLHVGVSEASPAFATGAASGPAATVH